MLKVQEAGIILRMGFALSKWLHLQVIHSALEVKVVEKKFPKKKPFSGDCPLKKGLRIEEMKIF